MSPSEIADLFIQHPNTRFRVTLSSGDQIVIENPERTLIDVLSLYISELDQPDSRVARRTRIVSVPNIAMLETIDPGHPGERRRRRR